MHLEDIVMSILKDRYSNGGVLEIMQSLWIPPCPLACWDLPDKDKLQAEDSDPSGQKSNLINPVYSRVSDDEFAMIDRLNETGL